MKNKLTDLFFINPQDGQADSGKNLSGSNHNISKIHHVNFINPLDHLYIKPSYINENEHIYDAPSLQNDHNLENNHHNYLQLREDCLSSNSREKKSGPSQRRFSLESARTQQTIRKKVNPLLKIATYITNKKFSEVDRAQAMKDTGSQYSQGLNRSAFKIIDSQGKGISLSNKKIINCNDFNEMLLGRNIVKPTPVRKDEVTSLKRGRDQDAMSVDNQSSFKKRRINEGSVFTSLPYINKCQIERGPKAHYINRGTPKTIFYERRL